MFKKEKPFQIKLLNYTPHTITMIGSLNEIVLELPSKGVARCKSTRYAVGQINGIPMNRTVFGNIEGLPNPKDDTYIIVSRIVAEAAAEAENPRNDLIIVDDTVRGADGQIIGARAFARI